MLMVVSFVTVAHFFCSQGAYDEILHRNNFYKKYKESSEEQ